MGGKALPASPRPGRARSPGVSLGVLFTLIGVANAAFYPFFSLLLRDRGLRADRIGVVLACMALSGLVASTIGGHVADVRLGRLATLRWSALSSIGLILALQFAGSGFLPILATAAALSALAAPITPVGDALALQHLGDEGRRDYGAIRMWSSLGFALASVAFGAAFQRAGLGWVLPTYAVTFLVLFGWSLAGGLPPGRPEPEAGGGRPGTVRDVLRAAPRLAAILSAVLLVAVGGTASFFFLPLRMRAVGGGPFLVGLATALGATAEVPVMGFGGRIARAIGLRGAFVLGALIYIGVFVTLAGLSSPVWLAVVFTGEGVAFGLVYVSVVVIVDHLVPPALRATGQGLRQTFQFGIAPIVGTAAGGFVFSRFGAPALFASAATVAALGAVLGWAALSRPEFSRREA